MGNSIITCDMTHCDVCGSSNVEWHHIVHGTANRALSDYYGLIIGLCPTHHRLSKDSVHKNAQMNRMYKRLAQQRFKQFYPELDFTEIFGVNYLEDK